MNVATITMDPLLAREKLRSTRIAVRARNAADLDTVAKRMKREDEALLRGYRHLAKGKALINLGHAIHDAGRNHDGLPLLAACRADATWCQASVGSDRVEFYRAETNSRGALDGRKRPDFACKLPSGPVQSVWRNRALVPSVPAELRPKAALHRFTILWEAEWGRVPTDPMLLRPLAGDLFVVEAHWDLTPLEQAVLAGRIG